MKVEENNKQDELKDEQLDNVAGGGEAGHASKAPKYTIRPM